MPCSINILMTFYLFKPFAIPIFQKPFPIAKTAPCPRFSISNIVVYTDKFSLNRYSSLLSQSVMITGKFTHVLYHSYLVSIVQIRMEHFYPHKEEANEVRFLVAQHQQPLQ
jgi:hypothetical protein